MSLTVLRAMLTGLLRDRGALALSFVLPVAFFLVFAAVFAGGSRDAPRLAVAIADEGENEASARLVAALAREPALEPIGADGKPVAEPLPPLSADDVRGLVRRGSADVGLVVRAGVGSLHAVMGEYEDEPPLLLVEDSAKGIAADILMGLIQRAYLTALPDVAARGGVELFEDQVGGLTAEQQARWERALAGLRRESLEGGGETGIGTDITESIEVERVTGRSAGQNYIAYYAGAVAVMFLLFGSAHAAALLLEEKEAGIIERVLAGPAGMAPLVNGKFLFLVLSGFVQVSLIFLVAWWLRGVDVPGHLIGYVIVTLAASAAAAGLTLALAAACSSRRQATNLATIVILILSAVGGSMVPRFFMPPWIQRLGWLTPNTWALEGYTNVFWRDAPLSALALPVGVLAAIALGGYATARLLARRWETI